MVVRSYTIISSDPGLDSEVFLRKKYAKAIEDSTMMSSKAGAVLLRLLVAPSLDGDELAARRRRRGGDIGATALRAVMKLSEIGFDKFPIRAMGEVTIEAEEAVCGSGRIEKDGDNRLKLLVSEKEVNPEDLGEANIEFNF
jgi:hypothetical protein